jgi:hypothetical protein
MSPDLSIIIVSYNCRALLNSCIRSLFESEEKISFEVIVSDNTSADGTTAMLQEDFPQVTLIANDSNLGYSIANNKGIRIAKGRYILLLNPDAEVIQNGTLDRLVTFMDSHSRVGAAGAHLAHPEGQKQVGGGYEPSPWTLFAYCFFLSKLTDNRIKGMTLLPPKDKSVEFIDVDWVCAACMIVRRETMDEVGMLDERYFMYGEDIEWGCRITRGGWTVCHIPSIHLQHIEAGTQKLIKRVPTGWVDGLERVYFELNPNSSRLYFKLCLGAGLALRAVMYSVVSLCTRDPWPRIRRLEMFTWLKHLFSSKTKRYQSSVGYLKDPKANIKGQDIR